MAVTLNASSQTPTKPEPDLQHQPTLYLAPYAHLDTQWIWSMQQSISEYMLKTMRLNFYYMDKYPHYVFNWTGSNRYRLMKEYYPSDYAKLKQYVAKGQWYPSGSSVEEPDMNLPSAESIVRQVLYGNDYFRKDFGKTSEDFFLPDCFGIPSSVPEILAHAGVKGFSTGKLDPHWSPSVQAGGPDSPEKTTRGIPFNVGLWVGPDGSTVLAALHPGGYTNGVHSDLTKPQVKSAEVPKGEHEQDWFTRINLDGKVSGVYADFRYVGTGDIGGATDEETVRLLEAIETKGMAVLPGPHDERSKDKPFAPEPQGTPVKLGDGPLNVIEGGSDLMFKAIKPEMQRNMPRYQGDLELAEHSAGTLTSQAYHKRWNRKNEILANAAEEASVAAAWLGGRTYPQQRLNDAWYLVMSGQFHDVAGGTASSTVYQGVQNDDVIALNQFAGVLTSATQAIASALDTGGPGVPVVVYNSLNVAREDVVEAAVPFSEVPPAGVRVTGPDGKDVPAQIENGKVLFVAKAPSVGYAVYHVEKNAAAQGTGELKVTTSTLENARYLVKLDVHGDVSSVLDKTLNKELLAAPVRLAISKDVPVRYPAWNMVFEQEQAEPLAYADSPVSTRIVENGPARVAIEVTRKVESSTFVQTVRLSAGGAGDRVEFADDIDWHFLASNLKAVFPLAANNKMATYTWDVGTLERPTATEHEFEVGSHQWIDLTDNTGKFGATILTDVKNGSDKRTDNTLRLTLLRTPGLGADEVNHDVYSYQQNQDWGHHEILYGIAGHANSWRESGSYWSAYRLSTPLESFVTTPHPGKLGRSFSIVSISDPHVRLLAMKKAEDSNDVIVRMVELDGKAAPHVRVSFAGPVTFAQAVTGQEEPKGPATVHDGVLETSFTPYQMQSFAIRLGAPPVPLDRVESAPVKLPYNLAASSEDDTKSVGGFNAKGDALPAEMLPESIDFNGVHFQLAPSGTGKQDAVIAKGQKVDLPAGSYNTVYVLAASADGDRNVSFGVGGSAVQVPVEAWNGFVGQWDTRLWKPAPAGKKTDWAFSANHATWDLKFNGSSGWNAKYPADFLGIKPGYIKRADIAWYASHHHTREGLNEPYEYSYLFAYALKLPPGATTLTLPKADNIRILAVSVAKQEPEVTPSTPLYDVLDAIE